MPDVPVLPRPIRWSAATAAFQVEGARSADGRGRSVWDAWVDTPGKVVDGSTADPGPDSYHRWADDVTLAANLGLDRYRFSISWTRVQPDGSGPGNAAGLDYYSRLVDDLLAAGVTPFPTLYHWDLPIGLHEAGGWTVRDIVGRFTDYAEIVAERLGDRVENWYTVNEPAMTTLEGYAIGALAPGEFLLFDALPTAHHQLLAHGHAARVLREHGARAVGVANNHTHVRPLHDSPEDASAVAAYDAVHNRLFADPILTGAYPDLPGIDVELPIVDGDLDVISIPPDFYAINFYNPTTVTAPGPDNPIPFEIVPTPGVPVTGFGPEWPIVPSTLRELLVDFSQRYPNLPPVIISENGASFPEPDTSDGTIDDAERIAYLDGHIRAVGDAMAACVRVDEYTVWSLMDNFEWADGYTQRFGLAHVDFDTGDRTPKASYDWYRRLIAENRR
ncbi:GH1 family beta-glucosidase [Gordonia sp. HY002]|uniref:GH1 family beta-glucosidase n=1 Tax=Gordonia zhenghanii TaxID=2911516 RepID=UPI001EF0DCBE|nr:GH1 family beta-glucosidase [Gordonia zhenghanii]MCF8570325.1 GH1 family beta-glucosidase [Gordonia zhenghanii]MCF8605941.1 GH1 family beta-glucosidase [Gordonia zhenghanii]